MTLITRTGWKELILSKEEVAHRLLSEIIRVREAVPRRKYLDFSGSNHTRMEWIWTYWSSASIFERKQMEDERFVTDLRSDERGNKKRRTFCHHFPPRGKTTLTEKFPCTAAPSTWRERLRGERRQSTRCPDWMDIEKERRNVTSSAMQFNYDGYRIKILDTPDTQDFSEDTYRTSDGGGLGGDGDRRFQVEAKTIKLFRVCVDATSRFSPFINKFDREARESLRAAGRDRGGVGNPHCPVNCPLARVSKGGTTALHARSPHSPPWAEPRRWPARN